mgnify:CR=1 FL=1
MKDIEASLMEGITTATSRLKHPLIWKRLAPYACSAEWENTCKLLFVHFSDRYELHVADMGGFHEPFVLVSCESDKQRQLRFVRLETVIVFQIDIARSCDERAVTARTQHDFLTHVITSLS